MDEAKYRSSRLCRLLGNPVTFQIVLLLDQGGPLTPSRLAKFAGRSIQTVSSHLAKLRNADVVRYDSAGREVRYRLKHKRETRELIKAMDRVIQAANRLA
jgi:DNA-binding transcriptional ArsR family regulator